MNEIRQKFEAWKMGERKRLANEFYESSAICDCPCELNGPADSPDSVFHTEHRNECSVLRLLDEAYEAGEIAMREKAAERIHHTFCRTADHMQNMCDCDEMADAIRALALSGAEESKKEK